MKRLIIQVLILLLLIFSLTNCASARKNRAELRGLMLMDNLQMSRNKAFHSRHSVKARNDAYKRYKKNSRNI